MDSVERVEKVISCLPQSVATAIESLKTSEKREICEIRLRAGAYQAVISTKGALLLSSNGQLLKNTDMPLVLTQEEIAKCVCKLCGGAVYSHAGEMSEGFFTFDGIRVGLCGIGRTKNGIPQGYTEYTSLNIRIPHFIKNASQPLLCHMRKHGSQHVGGVLVVSPPGVGKTTFLRSYAHALSTGYYDGDAFKISRVAIADERGEIYIPEAFEKSLCDVTSFLPKAHLISTLTRTMTPEYIVCDELDEEAAERIAEAYSKGVRLVASCHGIAFEDVEKRRAIKKLLETGAFGTVCELFMSDGQRKCEIKHI